MAREDSPPRHRLLYHGAMGFNADAVAAFEEFAALLELTGANGFRVNAHAKVARVLENAGSDLESLAIDGDAKKKLTKMDGIGASSADKLIELATSGRIEELETLRGEVPVGLRTVLEVPGLGPKTVRRLWTEAGVESLADLEARLDDGTVESLPRMGRKTVDNLVSSIAFMKRSGDRRRIDQAMDVAEMLISRMEATGFVERIHYAGSLRRGRETIGDLDILAVSSDPNALLGFFTNMNDVTQVLVAGDTKCSVRLEQGVQVDLRIVDAATWGAAIMYFTGSKEHNVLLRERAIARGMRLNEYGLFPASEDERPPQERGVTPVAAATETDIYGALDLEWIPPELREEGNPLERVGTTDLIRTEDVVAELHCHTVASDGRLSIEEMVEAAVAHGRTIIAITDHSKSSAQANGLSDERLREHIQAIREVDAGRTDIRVLAGSEVDILADGRLDYADELLEELDLVVASPHVSLRQDSEKATARLCRAARHPLVTIIGHPTGRIINGRAGLDIDIDALIEAALEGGTALEINANPHRLDLRDRHVRRAVDAGCPIAINTDAHAASHLDFLRYGVLTARRGGLSPAACVNTWPEAKLLDWIGR